MGQPGQLEFGMISVSEGSKLAGWWASGKIASVSRNPLTMKVRRVHSNKGGKAHG